MVTVNIKRADYEIIMNHLNRTKVYYRFLNFKESDWKRISDNIFIQFVKDNIDLPITKYYISSLNKKIKDIMSEWIKENNLNFLKNLFNLKKLDYQGLELLKVYFNTLRRLNLDISDDNYETLRRICPALENLLIKFKLNNVKYKDMNLILKNYEFLSRIKGNKSFYDAYVLLNYYLNILNVKLEVLVNDEELFKIIKLLIIKKDIFDKIYELYVNKIEEINRTLFDKVLLLFNYKELLEIVKDFGEYICNQKNETFLYRIFSKLKGLKNNIEKEEDSQNINFKREVSIECEFEFLEFMYKLFPDYEGISIDEKQNLVNELISYQSPESFTKLKNYFSAGSNRPKYETIRYTIRTLNRQYNNIIKGDIPANIKRARALRKFTELTCFTNINLPNSIKEQVYSISTKNLELLIEYLEIIELKYRESGFRKSEYIDNMNDFLSALYFDKPNSKLLYLVKKFIEFSERKFNLESLSFSHN